MIRDGIRGRGYPRHLKPMVGVATLITRLSEYDGHTEFLLQLRRGAHGANSWSVPGGHLEYGETFEQAAIREVKEEVGIDVHEIEFVGVTNNLPGTWSEREDVRYHYITVMMRAVRWSGTPHVVEPEKCHGVMWVRDEHKGSHILFEPLRAFFAGEGYP